MSLIRLFYTYLRIASVSRSLLPSCMALLRVSYGSLHTPELSGPSLFFPLPSSLSLLPSSLFPLSSSPLLPLFPYLLFLSRHFAPHVFRLKAPEPLHKMAAGFVTRWPTNTRVLLPPSRVTWGGFTMVHVQLRALHLLLHARSLQTLTPKP